MCHTVVFTSLFLFPRGAAARIPMPVPEREPYDRCRPTVAPDDLVFAHLCRTFARLRPEQTVADALASLRRQRLVEPVVGLYAVDAHDRLLGAVPLARLLSAAPHRRIASLVDTGVPRVPAEATMAGASALLRRHRRLALPVVGSLGRLYGVVHMAMLTADPTVLGERQAADHVFQLTGVDPSRRSGTRSALRLRIPSILCTLAGGLVAAAIVARFESLLETVIVLALFLPLVLALSESVGMQAATLALGNFRERRSDWRLMRRSLLREVATATLLGAACGAVIGGIAWLWQGRPWLAASVTATIACAMAVAALIGGVLPGLLRAARRDPRLASGPLVLALTDFFTLLLYFGIATALLG
jgi:magnesium transporter